MVPAVVATLLLLAVATAQGTPQERVAAAGERWLATDHSSRDELLATVKVLLDQEAHGIAWLATQLPAAAEAPGAPRSKGVTALVTHLTLDLLRRRRASGITFRGQYDALLALQPMSGDLLFEWLLATPDWYPTSHRIHLVHPLRDVQKNVPTAERLDGVVRIVEDARLEPENLRRGLAALLWQWGTRKYAQAMVTELVAATAEGDAEERVQTTLELADFYTQLGDWKLAATAHRSAQTLARGADVRLKPIAWYSAACVHALLGDSERGMQAIEACAAALASPDLDSSLRLARAMFDTDPELASLRTDARWAAALERAFPAPKDGGR